MSGEITILIVDDEIQIIRALKRALHSTGYEILEATGPEAAMNILDNTRPDIIICDYNMPGMCGIDVLKYAKKVLPNTFRVLMTGYSDLSIAVAAINEGSIYYYIAKPWKNDELTSMLQNIILKMRNQQEQSYTLNENYLSEVVKKMNAINKKTENNEQKFPLLEEDTIVLVNSEDILYLTAMEGDVVVITVGGEYISHESLNPWNDKLGKGSFFRCHRSYIVNT